MGRSRDDRAVRDPDPRAGKKPGCGAGVLLESPGCQGSAAGVACRRRDVTRRHARLGEVSGGQEEAAEDAGRSSYVAEVNCRDVPNRLASEASPYLLQHKDNPVDWYPWGNEAFARARQEDKPIFLSIGYSTCHWCHVMEHESFENAGLAELLNRNFVSIKVDREERPDVDRVYMTFVQATTGSGGWPMSVWLTPSLEPFYGGTYFPPDARWGKPGFAEILEEIARAWRDERGKVLQSAAHIVERLRSFSAQGGASRQVPPPVILDRAVAEFESAFDAKRGGFGNAPKFPRPSELLFLFREHTRTSRDQPRDMVLTTLQAMALGGMRDHVGGGFHR